jgi:hypothetical protein
VNKNSLIFFVALCLGSIAHGSDAKEWKSKIANWSIKLQNADIFAFKKKDNAGIKIYTTWKDTMKAINDSVIVSFDRVGVKIYYAHLPYYKALIGEESN